MELRSSDPNNERLMSKHDFLNNAGSDVSDEDDDSEAPSRASLHRVAKKSTNSPAAAAQPAKPYPIRNPKGALQQKTIAVAANRFLGNFNPETSTRERRKLTKKFNQNAAAVVRRPLGALYDEQGVHLTSGIDLCDCLVEECPGCFFKCIKCASTKCGIDCRVHRKFIYEQIEYHGYDLVVKNPVTRCYEMTA